MCCDRAWQAEKWKQIRGICLPSVLSSLMSSASKLTVDLFPYIQFPMLNGFQKHCRFHEHQILAELLRLVYPKCCQKGKIYDSTRKAPHGSRHFDCEIFASIWLFTYFRYETCFRRHTTENPTASHRSSDPHSC